MRLILILLILSMTSGCMLGLQTKNADPEVIKTEEDVYFLGFYGEPGSGFEQLSQALGEDTRNPWSLSNAFAQNAASVHSRFTLNPNIDRLNLQNAVYDFGVVSLRDFSVRRMKLSAISERTTVSIALTWTHIGHDLSTGAHEDKPEIRFTATAVSHSVFDHEKQLSSSQKKIQVQQAYKEAINKLMASLDQKFQRKTHLRDSDLLYLTISQPKLLPSLFEDLHQGYTAKDQKHLKDKMPMWISTSLENLISKELQVNPELDHVLLLPNTETAEHIMRVWPSFVERVQRLSPYSAAEASLGKTGPQIMSIMNLCDYQPGVQTDNQVVGIELRSALARMQKIQEQKIQLYAIALALDFKLPTDKDESVPLVKNLVKNFEKDDPSSLQQSPVKVTNQYQEVLQEVSEEGLIYSFINQSLWNQREEIWERLENAAHNMPHITDRQSICAHHFSEKTH